MPDALDILVAGTAAATRLGRALGRLGHRVGIAPLDSALPAIGDRTEAIILDAPREAALALCRRIKTRHQMPLLPVLVLRSRPRRVPHAPTAPDCWLSEDCRPREIVARTEELVRIRRAEREMVRLNTVLASLATENGRLYERARRDADATMQLLRELQHRVRNNLAAIQALLILEKHRTPPRPLREALDVALTRLRSMSAFQDALTSDASEVTLSTLARAITRNAMEIFGSGGRVLCEIRGEAVLPARTGNAVATALSELVMNAVRHAGASQLRVAIEREDRELKVAVVDDGRWLSESGADGTGLMIARTVVRDELHGSLSVSSNGGGTRACISFPLDDPTS